MSLRNTAEDSFALYHSTKTRPEFIQKALNTLLIGDAVTAELVWECFDVMTERSEGGG